MTKRMFLRGIVCLLVAVGILVWSPVLAGQRVFRNLTGTVTDGQHEPLRGAVVLVHCEATGTVVSYITDKTGLYSFQRLDGDLDYSVWATWRGRRSAAKKLSLFDSKADKVVNLEIAN